MSEAFVDTSMMLTLAFGEADAAAVRKRLAGFDTLLASPLLEAEFRSACLREGVNAESLTCHDR